MKKAIILLLIFTCVFNNSFSQIKQEILTSESLQDQREIKVLLPRSYNTPQAKKAYPLIVVLDADYLFEVVVGDTDYYAYWEDMPEVIVVGVNQANTRNDDSLYSDLNSLPIETGASFFDFIGSELLPHINKKYRISKFKTIVGHGETANFINYFLLKPEKIFDAYVAISPNLAPDMLDYIPNVLEKLETKTFYYLANTDGAPSLNMKMAKALNDDIKLIVNKNLLYKYDDFKGPSYFSLPVHAFPNAIESIFKIYQPISKKEFKETILKLGSSPVAYLQEKYQAIEDIFGIKKPILINDFKAIEAAIEKKAFFEDFEILGKLAREFYPETLLGGYYIGRFYEETGEYNKAVRTLQSAYTLAPAGGISKADLLKRADAIKSDFGL